MRSQVSATVELSSFVSCIITRRKVKTAVSGQPIVPSSRIKLLGQLDPWRWDRQVDPKRRFQTTLRRVITQETKQIHLVVLNMKCRLPSFPDDVRVARAGVVHDVLIIRSAAVQPNWHARTQKVRTQPAHHALSCLHSDQLHASAEQEPAGVRIALHHPDLRRPATQH